MGRWVHESAISCGWGAKTGNFLRSKIDMGGQTVQLTEPKNIFSILFAFLYPKAPPDIRYCGSWKVWGVLASGIFQRTIGVCSLGPLLAFFSVNNIGYYREFLPRRAPEILVNAVKHDYPTLNSAALPHFARAPVISVLKKLPPSYVVPWVCTFLK